VSTADEVYFDRLTSPQVAALRDGDRRPVLLLPVGAVEPHGPHAPLGTDPIISAGMCRRAARRLAGDPRLRVLILPALAYGVTRYAAAFPGAVGIGPRTLHAMVVDVCTSLIEQGLPRIVVVNNHFEPDHVDALRRAVGVVGVGYVDLLRRSTAARLTDEFRAGESHAGRYETSLVLAEHPDLVDAVTARALPRVPVNMVAAIRDGRTDFLAMGMTDGYCGSPAEATVAEGEATFDTLTELLVEVIRDVAS
jgi:creatinine amidohydrolase